MIRKILLITLVIFQMLATKTLANSIDGFAKSESLIAAGNYYEALIVLEPLIISNEKNIEQEQALWKANELCQFLINSYKLVEEFEKKYSTNSSEEEALKWNKIIKLNALGANIGWERIGGAYFYRYGFLKRLIKLYPESSLKLSAEYYLIEKGRNSRKAVEEYLCKLYEYIGKYQNQNIVELYKAYLDIAHINDNLWELLTYPDDYGKKFLSGDSKLDYNRVQKYKKEALFYYEKIVISGLFENDKIKKSVASK